MKKTKHSTLKVKYSFLMENNLNFLRCFLVRLESILFNMFNTKNKTK